MSLVPLLRQLNLALLGSVDKSERQVTSDHQYLVTAHKSIERGKFVDVNELYDLQIAVATFLDKAAEIL